LIGGEPFLYWDDRIVPLAKKCNEYFKGTQINIPTNGQLLAKNIDKIIELSKVIDNFSITVTRHLEGVDHKIKEIWSNGVDALENHPEIIKLHNDHYHIKGNIYANIYFFKGRNWKFYYYRDQDNKIKPWATNDPAGSMRHGCPGPVCSGIIDNKLYKCPQLATLPDLLTTLNQQDDQDWSKYLNYPFIDLNNIDPEKWKNFVDSYGSPTTWCDMCNNKPENNVPWNQRTYEMVFVRNNLKNTMLA
jgi:hypothetical protein